MKPGLPQKTLPDGSVSKVTIVPFYDRTGLIKETIGTLESALSHEILISIIVIIVLVMNLRASLIVAGLLPIGVLMTFILMRLFGIDANIVALSGIAIAIGVMVDIGIVDVENILRHLEMPENKGIRGKKLLAGYLPGNDRSSRSGSYINCNNHCQLPACFCHAGCRRKIISSSGIYKNICPYRCIYSWYCGLPTLVHIFFNIRFDTKKIRKVWNGSLIIAGIWHLLYSGKPGLHWL